MIIRVVGATHFIIGRDMATPSRPSPAKTTTDRTRHELAVQLEDELGEHIETCQV